MLSPRPSNAPALRVVIVDDDAFTLDLMTRLLARQRAHYDVVAAVGSASEAIAACGQFRPDVLVLDINLPDQNGIDALPSVRRAAPGTRVLLCTGYSIAQGVDNIAQSGAEGFVEKTHSWDAFLDAVERVGRGERYFSWHTTVTVSQPAASERTLTKSQTAKLTKREKEIINLIAQGLTSKEIASNLGIGVGTVETHRTNLMKKLRVRNVAALVSVAFRTGLANGARHPS
jgi:DNA-binding NarL/FixJ family response regulator